MVEPEQIDTVKEKRWWQVDCEGRVLTTTNEQEARTFCAELTRYNRTHELRLVESVERTTTVKRRVMQ